MQTRIVLVVLVAVLVAGACGSGGGRLSTAALRERAGEACAAANERIAELGPVAGGDPARAAAHLEALVDIQRDAHGELARLRPPADLQDTYDGWITHLEAALDATAELAAALHDGDPAAQEAALDAAIPAGADAHDGASALALDGCTDGAVAPGASEEAAAG